MHVQGKRENAERVAREVQATVDAWEERAARSVVIEERTAPIHMGQARYGKRTVGACVASAMGAQRFAGQTTDDAAQVTCTRCIKHMARMAELKAKRARNERWE
jgi:hypothetical protein